MSILGTRVVRTEDPRLLTAGAIYLEDLRLPELQGAAYATFVRSPMAHARITEIDVSAALAEPGVVAVLTARDLDDIPDQSGAAGAEPLLAVDVVRFAGEPVAIVLTEESYQGEDAAELVSVDYEELPAVIGVQQGLSDETLLFPGSDSNVVGKGGAESFDDAAFAGCEVVVERTIVNQRVAAAPLEVRAAAARWAEDRLTLWVSTQNVHGVRDQTAGRLGLDPGAVRVVAPDVGGGFGAKIGADRETIVVGWAARRLGRPVRWVETRNENLMGMSHGRAQRHTVTIGGSRDGRVAAYRLDIVQDCGAYIRLGTMLPNLTMLMAGGVYDLPRIETAYRAVLTNTTPIGAYRGAGRPEATAAIERAMDLFAAEIGMDPTEVRRVNFVAPDKFPFTTKTGATYDTGEYAKALDTVLEAAGYEELRAEQRRRRERGDPLQLGIGVSTYVEITGGGPEAGETARLSVHDDGTVTVWTGSSPHGQGHATAWAMLVQDELGIPMDRVTVRHGDTDVLKEGVGTFGSRSLQLGGTAVHNAAVEVKERARELAADEMEADPADLVLDVESGTWTVRGVPGQGVSWARLAERAGPDGLSADTKFATNQATFPFGAHVAVVEVDLETGRPRLVRHVTVDDAGPVLNPILAEGQRHGGIAQGAAQALYEEVAYDEYGNPVTATLMDYTFITAAELPSFELVAMETPTSANPLGVKGIGEAGTIGSTPAVQSAVVDALAHLGIRHIDMPATPERVWTAINEARTAQ
ncbi:xanthine dehydrogenase family protein molybdopterin-binding subunit [Actinoallomurus bryophytorum]|uniref:Carbon-monoxide dehydrogenase large subunit n=1 Tax=Actinoallomurus bryophytorum TaxID=1490222 RepID=A0A543CPT4_9ACTN|nr:xanthine dehydrogenase family protein molybdopterin-binding subunit [Actinoallomurus bryophytorum]TQL98957.1 carbon-monoxide dehydrogenase large subunit [Actinoallomurus bryophytorum]